MPIVIVSDSQHADCLWTKFIAFEVRVTFSTSSSNFLLCN